METLLHEPPVEAARSYKPRHWLRRGTVTILILAAIVWCGDTALSFLVDHSRLRARITSHLESAFGRPVVVGSYSFSIRGGPVLEAHSVRIGEDPRFGNEYFIRADSIAVGLRFWSLLHGHIALGTLSVNGASLNLVRSADGDWNLAEWLPRPPPGLPSAQPLAPPAVPSPAVQFRRIDISDSRIDFKRGYEKLPFALVDVNGSMETDAPGRWRIDMTASPWRAAVLTQQPGIIRVAGHIGGTSSRLRPAALDVSWTDASISDVFRLARGDDYGIRGDLAISIGARTEPADPTKGWVISGQAEIRGLHRWDMAARPDNPSLNFMVNQALLDPGLSELRVSDLRIQAPHSNALASAAFNWTGQRPAGKLAVAAANFIDLNSAQVDLDDALAWVRAFHPGVPNGTSMHGMVDVHARFTGWPPILASAAVIGEGADLSSSALQGPAHLAPIDLRFSRGAISLEPATISWSTLVDREAGSFRIKASARGKNALFPSWHIAGSAADARGILALAAALGLNFSHGWDLQGPLSCDLDWQSAQYPWNSLPAGTISLGADGSEPAGAALRTPFLNLPIEQIRARIEMKPDASRISLASAKAFGTNWSGTFDRRSADAEWKFALSADRLSTADLDRWLNPRWRESFLDRMLPFLEPQPASSTSAENLRANGSLNLSEFVLEPLNLRHLTGDLRLDGRSIEFSDAKGQFYGGEASGLLRADLSADPVYHAEVAVSRIDAAALTAATPALAGLRAETLEGRMSIDAKGASRSDLISSIACRGIALADGIVLHDVNFTQPLGSSSQLPGDARIAAASAAFTCSHRVIQFQRLSLVLLGGQSLIGAGSIGFDRSLDLRLQNSSTGSKNGTAAFRITGNLPSPEFTRITPVRRGR